MKAVHWTILGGAVIVLIALWPALASNALFVAAFSIGVGGLLVRVIALDWEHRYWRRQKAYDFRVETMRALSRAYQDLVQAEAHEEYLNGLPSERFTMAIKELSIVVQDIALAFAEDAEVTQFLSVEANEIGFMTQDVLQDTKKRRKYLPERHERVSRWNQVLWRGLKRT